MERELRRRAAGEPCARAQTAEELALQVLEPRRGCRGSGRTGSGLSASRGLLGRGALGGDDRSGPARAIDRSLPRAAGGRDRETRERAGVERASKIRADPRSRTEER